VAGKASGTTNPIEQQCCEQHDNPPGKEERHAGTDKRDGDARTPGPSTVAMTFVPSQPHSSDPKAGAARDWIEGPPANSTERSRDRCRRHDDE